MLSPVNPKRPIIGFGTAFLLMAFIFFTSFGVATLHILKANHEYKMIDETCYMYFKNGVPQTVEIYDTMYHLNPDYSITDEDKIRLNPYHQMELAQKECVKMNIKENDYIQPQE